MLDSASRVNTAVLRAGGILWVMDNVLYIFPKQVLERNPMLDRLVARFNRELRYKLASLAL